jgi:predicted lactoylglutathione lyase
MGDMTTIEIKAFVPARDFEQSKRFYQELGFDIAWSDGNWHTSDMGTQASYCRISTTRPMPTTS